MFNIIHLCKNTACIIDTNAHAYIMRPIKQAACDKPAAMAQLIKVARLQKLLDKRIKQCIMRTIRQAQCASLITGLRQRQYPATVTRRAACQHAINNGIASQGVKTACRVTARWNSWPARPRIVKRLSPRGFTADSDNVPKARDMRCRGRATIMPRKIAVRTHASQVRAIPARDADRQQCHHAHRQTVCHASMQSMARVNAKIPRCSAPAPYRADISAAAQQTLHGLKGVL